MRERSEILLATVVYNPAAELVERVRIAAGMGFDVYAFDNSPTVREVTDQIRSLERVRYFTAGQNVGLGFALSLLCATAYAEGYRFVLFLDQDTGISEATLDYVRNFERQKSALLTDGYAAVVFDGTSSESSTTIEDVALAISSGSMYVLSNLKEVGWHNVSYFVDCVDYEFCIRSVMAGFRIGLVRNTPGFDHVTEQPDKIIRLFGRSLRVRRYAASRVRDAVKGYFRLMVYAVSRLAFGYFLILAKSFAIYAVGQCASRFISKDRAACK